jgi:hypothetical protein
VRLQRGAGDLARREAVIRSELEQRIVRGIGVLQWCGGTCIALVLAGALLQRLQLMVWGFRGTFLFGGLFATSPLALALTWSARGRLAELPPWVRRLARMDGWWLLAFGVAVAAFSRGTERAIGVAALALGAVTVRAVPRLSIAELLQGWGPIWDGSWWGRRQLPPDILAAWNGAFLFLVFLFYALFPSIPRPNRANVLQSTLKALADAEVRFHADSGRYFGRRALTRRFHVSPGTELLLFADDSSFYATAFADGRPDVSCEVFGGARPTTATRAANPGEPVC